MRYPESNSLRYVKFAGQCTEAMATNVSTINEIEKKRVAKPNSKARAPTISKK